MTCSSDACSRGLMTCGSATGLLDFLRLRPPRRVRFFLGASTVLISSVSILSSLVLPMTPALTKLVAMRPTRWLGLGSFSAGFVLLDKVGRLELGLKVLLQKRRVIRADLKLTIVPTLPNTASRTGFAHLEMYWLATVKFRAYLRASLKMTAKESVAKFWNSSTYR
jgi:hypothetical protein